MTGIGWALALALSVGAQDGALDWQTLPPLPYRTAPALTPPMHAFVANEARTRRCPVRRNDDSADRTLRIDLAVLVNAEGAIRVVMPRAARCPTVEQYAAGLVSSFARNNLLPRGATSDQWYRTSLTFTVRQ